jgi:hypothetical protein
MPDIGLVGCSRRKLPHAAPARELYTSPLFRLASCYCARTCDRWFVLSAQHGLVEPDDVTLRALGRAGRQAWARRVVGQLRRRGLLGRGHRLLLHAGADYADALAALTGAECPLRGLGIGQRLAWYRRRLGPEPPRSKS